jgi:hypothetical protein
MPASTRHAIFVLAVSEMRGARAGGCAKMARRAMRVVGVMLALVAEASGQTAVPAESLPTAPDDTPTAPPSPDTPVEPRPTEFPGVIQGGVVGATPRSYERPWSTQRNFALVATEGSFNGFGLGFRGGAPRVGLDGSFAFAPVFATYSPEPDTFPELKLLSAFQASATMYLGLHRLNSRTDLGLAFGYKYSTLLRHGGTIAFYIQRELAAHWTLQAFIGPCIFPDAEDQIRQKTGWVNGSVLSGLAWHQAGIGVSLAFFP